MIGYSLSTARRARYRHARLALALHAQRSTATGCGETRRPKRRLRVGPK
jgi:hypothetical protein